MNNTNQPQASAQGAQQHAHQIIRVELMAHNDARDLSDNDCSALVAVLADRAALLELLAKIDAIVAAAEGK